MDLKDKRILIAGGTGFIGKYVVAQLLARGAKVFCLTRQTLGSQDPNLTYIQCDLNSIKPGAGQDIGQVDCIIYMAASIPDSTQQKEGFFEAKRTTFDPCINFFEEFGNWAQKIVYVSTIDIYGPAPAGVIDEDTPASPSTPYAVAKLCLEDFVRFYCKAANKTCVILRFSQVYGPREPKVRVMSFIMDAAVRNKEFALRGTGEEKRKFLYVADAAMAVVQSISFERSDIFVIAGQEATSIKEVILIVESITGKRLKIKQAWSDRTGASILPDSTKADKILGFQAKTSINEGVKATLGQTYENPQ